MLSRTTLAIFFTAGLLIGQAASVSAMVNRIALSGEKTSLSYSVEACDVVNDLSGCSRS